MDRPLLPLLAAFAIALGACSDEDAHHAPDHESPHATGCAADERKDHYEPGMTKPAGDLSVKLVEASPAPLAKGENTLTLEITSGGGAPVDGAMVTVQPFMPDHAHGSAVTPVVTPSGGGRYVVTNLQLAMAGLWRLTVSVQPAGGGPLQEAVFQFCVDG